MKKTKLTEKDFEKIKNDIIQAFQECYGLIGEELINRKRNTKFNKELKFYSPIGGLTIGNVLIVYQTENNYLYIGFGGVFSRRRSHSVQDKILEIANIKYDSDAGWRQVGL